MPNWLLNLNVMTGLVPVVVWLVTSALVIALAVRTRTRRQVLGLLAAVAVGAAIGWAVAAIVDRSHVVDAPLPEESRWWTAAAGAGLGLAVASLRRSPLWRKVIAGLLIVGALLSAGIGVNRAYGLTPTIGTIFGMNTTEPIATLPARLPPHTTAASAGPLYQRWTPPEDMPAVGVSGALAGDLRIPSTAGFVPRDASIYLPPAALVKDPPALPLVVMMMGKPGSPTPYPTAAILDQLASRNQGLAPITIIVDQTGTLDHDPVCSDSSVFGGVSTYINADLVAYAKKHLNVLEDPRYWTIAGYSNGGACALTWAAEFPGIWGNMISVSGDEFPGAENPSRAIVEGFGGDAAAFEAAKPRALLAAHAGAFNGHFAVLTAGEKDTKFKAFAVENARLTQQAGFTTVVHMVPGALHVGSALGHGLDFGLGALFPVVGLSEGAG